MDICNPIGVCFAEIIKSLLSNQREENYKKIYRGSRKLILIKNTRIGKLLVIGNNDTNHKR